MASVRFVDCSKFIEKQCFSCRCCITSEEVGELLRTGWVRIVEEASWTISESFYTDRGEHTMNIRQIADNVTEIGTAFFLHLWDRASLMYSFKYNQRDATLYNILCCCQCSACFRRFLRPSSGAQNCTHSIG